MIWTISYGLYGQGFCSYSHSIEKIKNWINSKKVVTADLYRLVVRLNKNSAGTKINPSSTLLKSFESDEP